jgi:hypothetical protein
MSEKQQELTAQDADLLLCKGGELRDNIAWKAIIARHAEEMAKIEARILDASTPDEDSNALRRARAVYLELAPTKLLERNQTRFQNILDKTGFRKQ